MSLQLPLLTFLIICFCSFGTWTLLDVRIEGFDAELRIDKGPATQLTSVGHAPFTASQIVYVGGVSLWDRAQVIIEYRSVTSQLFIDMETCSKQFQAVRGSVITTVANNTSARLQPTARSLVQGSLV